ncbi:Uncharacterised protein [Mycobacteroides abscessus subsp. abscessus]|uniref:pathogenicity island family protein n=1 Tax=Staphylococcus haemolyticus TaxID=1283 RepID=UPI00069E53D9|nr:pathogenicity island family protein [Staphylococcus haemolyticus]SIK51888.1 Uncharacterised protein [Mycobacteroides abscessus subsp. abscessus]
MFSEDKETLKTFIFNYHNYVNDDYKDIPANEFFTLNDEVEEYSYQTINGDKHIFMNELYAFVDQMATDKEYFIFDTLLSGRSYKEISQVLRCSIESIRKWFDNLLDKIIENKE